MKYTDQVRTPGTTHAPYPKFPLSFWQKAWTNIKSVLSIVYKNSRNCTNSAWYQCLVTPSASCEESWLLSVSKIRYWMLRKKVCHRLCHIKPSSPSLDNPSAILQCQHDKTIRLPALSSSPQPLNPHDPPQFHQCWTSKARWSPRFHPKHRVPLCVEQSFSECFAFWLSWELMIGTVM